MSIILDQTKLCAIQTDFVRVLLNSTDEFKLKCSFVPDYYTVESGFITSTGEKLVRVETDLPNQSGRTSDIVYRSTPLNSPVHYLNHARHRFDQHTYHVQVFDVINDNLLTGASHILLMKFTFYRYQ